MRLPYIADPPPVASAEEAAVVSRIQARRAPKPLQALDLTLLHSVPVADGWNSFLGAIRSRTSLEADIRELVISRVAVCNEAWYEWKHHAPLAAQAGLDSRALDLLRRPGSPAAEDRQLLSEKQWAALLYADEMTRSVKVKDETFALLKTFFDNQQIVELTATVRHLAG